MTPAHEDRPATSDGDVPGPHGYIAHAPDGVIVADQTGRCVEVNAAAVRLSGYPEDELLRMSIADLLAGVPGAERQDPVRFLKETGSLSAETRFFRKDGTELRLSVQANKLSDTRYIFFVRDLTERRRTESELVEARELFKLFLAYSPIYAFMKEVTPTESRVLQASENYEQLIGIRGSDMAGRTMAELFPPEFAAKMTADDWTVVSEGVTLTLDEDFNGRHYLTVKSPILLGSRKLLAGYTIDVTERKQAEETRARLEAQLHQAQKMESIGRLAGGVAHDFNNMLGVILGNADLALDQADPNPALRGHLAEIRAAAERSGDLTRQLLAFARKQTVAPKVLDLNGHLSGTVAMLQRLIGENIRLDWQPTAGLWPVRVDPSQVDQILTNLCVNARDAIADVGVVTVRTENVAQGSDPDAEPPNALPGDYVRLSVSDSGCGMDEQTLKSVFEPFFTTKEAGRGTGLGLATVYGAVHQNGGFVTARSAPGCGTTFAIHLPRHAGTSDVPRQDDATRPGRRGREVVLLVEDEPAVLKVASAILANQGYSVVAAQSPGEAIRLAREHPGRIDLLLTDVVMPEMNGRDLARNLLALHPDMRRVFMSGYTADVIAHQGVLDEGVHFLQKPFSGARLAAFVREVLDE